MLSIPSPPPATCSQTLPFTGRRRYWQPRLPSTVHPRYWRPPQCSTGIELRHIPLVWAIIRKAKSEIMNVLCGVQNDNATCTNDMKPLRNDITQVPCGG